MLFAMALPTWKCEQPHDVSKAIVCDERVEYIDIVTFNDCDNFCASTFSDFDLKQILVLIDAVNHLKILRLCGCTQIEGHGLEPLRGSTVIEKLDISIRYRFERWDENSSKFRISPGAIVPILNSILDADGSRLKHIQFPNFSEEDDAFSQLLARYNNLAIKCDKCKVVDVDRGLSIEEFNGIEGRTCYECDKHYCSDCQRVIARRLFGNSFRTCKNCRKATCPDCCEVRNCSECWTFSCEGCATGCRQECWICDECTLVCAICRRISCRCSIIVCHLCEKVQCRDCGGFCYCEKCNKCLCQECGGIGHNADSHDSSCSICCCRCLDVSSTNCLECLKQYQAYLS